MIKGSDPHNTNPLSLAAVGRLACTVASRAVTRPTRLDDVTENTLLRKATDGTTVAACTLNTTDPAHR